MSELGKNIMIVVLAAIPIVQNTLPHVLAFFKGRKRDAVAIEVEEKTLHMNAEDWNEKRVNQLRLTVGQLEVENALLREAKGKVERALELEKNECHKRITAVEKELNTLREDFTFFKKTHKL